MAKAAKKKSSPGSKKTFKKHLEVAPISADYKGSGKLASKVGLITGGDSGIGRSVALYFAREGADIAIVYRKSDEDAAETKELVEAEGRECLVIKSDVSKQSNCINIIERVKKKFGALDILVNNAGMHQEDDEIKNISSGQLKQTFEVNIFSMFYLCKAAIDIMGKGSSIINTASVTAYRGSEHLLDYSATKGAIVSFTRSLAQNLVEKGIRVNAVAPGPIWTPLVINAFDADHLKKFGKDTPMKRAGYPYELAPAYVYLACGDSTYVTGQTMHVNGGDVMDS
jgi:NAD(P)-dependent dehydrogenase (short-subunit alcohol dehydrogenase family)